MPEPQTPTPAQEVPEVFVNTVEPGDFIDLECCKCHQITKGKTAQMFRGVCSHCNHILADKPGSDCVCMGLLIEGRVAGQPGSGEFVGKGFLMKTPVGKPVETKTEVLPSGDVLMTVHQQDDTPEERSELIKKAKEYIESFRGQ